MGMVFDTLYSGMYKMTEQKGNAPTLKERVGNVTATVWTNIHQKDGKSFSFESISVQRSYKDGEEWKNTDSFGVNDLHKLILCLEEVQRKLLLAKE